MAQVVTFEDFTPIARYDATPWTEARIEEGTTTTGPWAEVETITLSPVDSDPANPLTRNLTTELASDDADLWYRIVFVDGTGDESVPTEPVQNTGAGTTYADTDELFRLLKIANPTSAQTAAAIRVLTMASGEIDAEVDREDDDPLAGWELALAEEVCLERAVELWRETPFGIVGIDSEFGATRTSRDTWARYAYKLAPAKRRWGFA